MRILHYFLGFPPYRTGGLTKFAYDLMMQQKIDGNEVMALWPGQITIIKTKTAIKRRNDVSGISNYELVNPLPVPLDEGIAAPDYYMQATDASVYKAFLQECKPDVIHIHTMMGLHEEFFTAARECKVRVVYTTHDYFGICNKVYLYRKCESCDVNCKINNCAACNQSGLSYKKIVLMQSPIYRRLKNTYIVRMLRKRHRAVYFDEKDIDCDITVKDEKILKSYEALRAFYKRLFGYIDCFHFTSTVSGDVYKSFMNNIEGQVISITHKGISDMRQKKESYSDLLRLTCLAPAKPYKGFHIIRRALDELWDEGKRDFVLNIYSPVSNPAPYMIVHENGYSYDELDEILSNTDIVLATSVWHETFGYTVLESVSRGVPVIVSDCMGAKDVIADGGIVVHSGDVNDLKQAVLSLDRELLDRLNQNILAHVSIKEWRQFTDEIYDFYSTAVGNN